MRISALIFVAVGAVALGACKRAALTTEPTEDDVATVDAIRKTNPPFCRAALARVAWDECADGTRGYETLFACAETSANTARQAVAGWLATERQTPCAINVESALLAATRGYAAFADANLAFLKNNASALRANLAKKTLTDFCAEKTGQCQAMGMPPPFTGLNQAAIECTKSLFICGDVRNVCWHSKVASRLGVACDPSENQPLDPLMSATTTKRLN